MSFTEDKEDGACYAGQPKTFDDKDYKIMGLESELKTVVDVLLKVSPEHKDWIKMNFPNYNAFVNEVKDEI